MVDLNQYGAGDIFTVFLFETPKTTTLEDGTTITEYLGGVTYWSGLPNQYIMPVTFSAVPTGRPFIMMLLSDIQDDYSSNVDFLNTLDFNNPDGYGS